MTPLVSNLWPQFMVDPAFAACFGQVIVEHAQMLRQERQVIFTLRSGAPLDKNLCARLLASLQPDYEGFELRIQNLFGYAMLDEAALRDLMEEMKRDVRLPSLHRIVFCWVWRFSAQLPTPHMYSRILLTG